ncbi:MAG: VCBS repeat-containing protein, partial [Candidatus Zixiibacteriota bacterium]
MIVTILLLIPLCLWAQEFPFVQEYDTIPVTLGEWQPPVSWTTGMSFSYPAFGDLDSDGDWDLLVGNIQNELYLFLNQGSPIQAQFTWGDIGLLGLDTVRSWVNPEWCDLDGDGDEDLLLADEPSLPKLYRNESTPGQVSFILADDSLTGPTWVATLATVDIDADGDFDLFSGNQYGRLHFFQNFGTPQQYTFQQVTNYFAAIDVGSFSEPVFCDIDSDGDFDLFVGNYSGRIWYYRNDGTPQQYSFTLVS